MESSALAMRRDPFLATRPSGPGHIKRLGSASEQSPTVSGVLPSTAFRDASTSSLRDGTSVFHSCKPTHSGLQPILVCYQFTALLRFRAQRWQNTTSVGDVMYLLSSDALRDSNRVLTGRWTRCVSVYPSSRHGRFPFPCRWQPPAVEKVHAHGRLARPSRAAEKIPVRDPLLLVLPGRLEMAWSPGLDHALNRIGIPTCQHASCQLPCEHA